MAAHKRMRNRERLLNARYLATSNSQVSTQYMIHLHTHSHTHPPTRRAVQTGNPLQQERQEDKQCFYADSLAFSDSWSYLALSELNSVKQHEPNTRREFLVL